MNSQELNQKIRAIRHAENQIKPDQAWVSDTRAKLLKQVSRDMAFMNPVLTSPIRDFFKNILPPRVVQFVRGPVLALFSVFGVVMGTSIASVSAAERSIPGDFLYPVKLVTEQTRLILTASKTDKLKLKTEFVQRRVQEIKDIVSQDVPQKPQRITEAAEMLKRDLDTVKTQLQEVSAQSTPVEAAQAAKLVDQKSTEMAGELKTMKDTVPDDVRSKVTEAEGAAVHTGVKAVQVLIDTHDNPDAKNVVTDKELVDSLNGKIKGMEQGMVDASQKLLTGGVSSTNNLLALPTVASSTAAMDDGHVSSTTAFGQIVTAQASLQETKNLIEQNKIDEAKDKIGEASRAVATVEAQVTALGTAQAPVTTSSTSDIIPGQILVPTITASSTTVTTTTIITPKVSVTTATVTTTQATNTSVSTPTKP